LLKDIFDVFILQQINIWVLELKEGKRQIIPTVLYDCSRPQKRLGEKEK